MCPRTLSDVLELWLPPLSVITEGVLFPFCIARGVDMIKAIHLEFN